MTSQASEPTAQPTSQPHLPSSLSNSSPYPYAAAPDIIRAHQKDAYFQGHLHNTITDLHRRLLGTRSAHAHAAQTRTAADLLYLSLTTLIGNRTLGEEYTDVVQVSGADGSLPTLRKRAAYVASAVLLPYALARVLPGFRARVRKLLEPRIARLAAEGKGNGREGRAWRYLATHLAGLTSGAHIHALTLALFYFSGTYYSLAKRLLGLRYVFTRKVPSTPDRAGYEVLGVLLVVQMAVQAYLHIRTTLAAAGEGQEQQYLQREAGMYTADVNVSLDENAYSANNELLVSDLGGLPGGAAGAHASSVDIEAATHTPVPRTPRYNLRDDGVMGFIKGAQQRKCTLCLEELKDPSATQCGHVFCWECIGDWVREKPECPLCRRETMVQHILPLRVA
jgi:peroxin-10